MPYLSDLRRRELLLPGAEAPAENAAELTYQICVLMDAYAQHHGLSYKTCHDIAGAAEDAIAEFRRVVMGEYEQSKLSKNGTVWMCLR